MDNTFTFKIILVKVFLAIVNGSKVARRNKNNAQMRKEDAQAAAIEKAALAAQAKTDAQAQAMSLDEEQQFANNKDQLQNIDIRNSADIKLNAQQTINEEDPSRSPYKAIGSSEQLKTAGALLRYHRQRAGISLNEVASKLKVRNITIGDIENDRVSDENCKNYMSPIIRNYASLLQIDPQAVAELYEQNIAEKIRIKHEKTKHNETGAYTRRNWVLFFLIIIVAAAGYFIFGKDKGVKEQDLSGSLNDNRQVSNNAPLIDEPLVSGSLNSNNNDSQQSIVIEDEKNKTAKAVVVVDENTAKATAQAQALEQDLLNSTDKVERDFNKHSLELPNSTNLSIDETKAPEVRTNSAIEAVVKDNKAVISSSKDNAKSQKETQAKAEIKEVNQQDKAKLNNTNKDAQSAALATSNKVELEKNKAQESKQKDSESKKASYKLNSNLKDISSQVSVINREGLASLNTVEISFTKDAYFVLVDGTNKVKNEGFYEKGKSLKITGIPPFKLSVTDTSALKVSYMGGTVKMPKAKQVKFELPMR